MNDVGHAAMTAGGLPVRFVYSFTRGVIFALVRRTGVAVLVCCGILYPIHGQTAPVTAQQPPSATPAGPPPVVAIPLAEVVSQAGAVATRIQKIGDETTSDPIAASINAQLPILLHEIDARSAETAKILESNPSLDTLRNLDEEWQSTGSGLATWKRQLTAIATELDRLVVSFTQLGATWNATLAEADSGPAAHPNRARTAGAPPEIVALIQRTIDSIRQARESYERRQSEILSLQNRVAEQEARIANARSAIDLVRQEMVNRLFVKDSPPIWSEQLRERARARLLEDSRASLREQLNGVVSYSKLEVQEFFAQAIIALLLTGCLYWVRRRVQPWLAGDPAVVAAARIFDQPVATAFVFTILISGWIHPQAPRLFTALVGAAALIPTVFILRHLVEPHLRSIFSALVVFYFVDLFRGIAVTLPLLTRILFLAELLGGIAFMSWLIASGRLSFAGRELGDSLPGALRMGVRMALPLFTVAAIANALGYISLAGIVGNTVLGGAYLAAILFVGVRIADGLLMFVSHVRPLSLLGMIQHHRPLLRRRIHRALVCGASILWISFVLEQLSLRAPVFAYLRLALIAPLGVGKVQFTFGAVLVFGLTVWVAFLLSRLIRFILSEDVYPRVGLARGVPYAISTMLHYTILLLGFFVALAALGVDMTKFTILAGAFGVGLGFGLQTIVNNFVSGIILLFEQPVKVGDAIQLGPNAGALRHIGLRASVMRTWEGSEVIIPNGELISGQVTNLTPSDQRCRMDILVGVAYGTDPEQVIRILSRVAAKHPDVMADPPPLALFLSFGDSALEFQLRAWTTFDRSLVVKSDLTIGVNAALRDAGIAIPFPQRDLRIQTVPEESIPKTSGRES